MWRNIFDVPKFCIGFYTALFVLIWMGGWVSNAVFTTNFDLDRLKDIYVWVMTQINANHAINSIWNSPKGSEPDDSAIATANKSSHY